MDKPEAVLIYDCKKTGILSEGLIYEAGERIITIDRGDLEYFESDYCGQCIHYAYNLESPPYLSGFIRNIKEELEDNYKEYESCLSFIETIYSVEDVSDTLKILRTKEGLSVSYCVEQLENYIKMCQRWEELKEVKNCEGGQYVLKKGECSEQNVDDLVELEYIKVKLPPHLWLKLSLIQKPSIYDYYLLGFFEGYITPGLTVGNVSGAQVQIFSTEELIPGVICWGGIKPSSNIKEAYKQFWGSVFNEDIDKPIEFDNYDTFSDIFTEWVYSCVKDKYHSFWTNNFLLDNGKLKPGVKLYKLAP
jgi:hypothetical protein